MGKKIFKITDVSGGLNENSPRDINDNELAAANCIDLTIKGTIRAGVMMDTSASHTYQMPSTNGLHFTGEEGETDVYASDGFGLHLFTSQYVPGNTSGSISLAAWDGVIPTAQIGVGGSANATSVADSNDITPARLVAWAKGTSNAEANDITSGAGASTNDEIAELGIFKAGNGLGSAIFSAGPIGNNTCNHDKMKPVWYKAGGKYYACDGNLANSLNVNRACTGHTSYRFFGSIAASDYSVSKWTIGPAVLRLNSESVNTSAAANKIHADINSGYTTTANDGGITVNLDDSGTGLWDGDYYFYASVLYDNGLETNYIQLSGTALSCAGTSLALQLGARISSSVAPLGNDRIHGIRVYWSESDIAAPDGVASDIYLLCAYDFRKGVRLANQSDWMKVEFNDPVYEMDSTVLLTDPAEFKLFTYEDLHGYSVEDIPEYANPNQQDGAVRYTCAAVGSNNRAYIGNVMMADEAYADRIYYSEVGEYGVFPSSNYIDFPHSNSTITGLLSYADRIFVFSEDCVNVLNVAQTPFVESTYKEGGIFYSFSACVIPDGVACGNRNGLHIYQRGRWTNVFREKNILASNFKPVLGFDYASTNQLIYRDDEDDTDGYSLNLKTGAISELDSCFNADYSSNFETSKYTTEAGILHCARYTDIETNPATTARFSRTNSSAPMSFTTKQYDLTGPGNFKNIYKVSFAITGTADADMDTLEFLTDKSDQFRPLVTAKGGTTSANLGGSNPATANGYITVFFHNTYKAFVRGCRWIQLKVAGGSDITSAFEIGEILITYRDLGEKE